LGAEEGIGMEWAEWTGKEESESTKVKAQQHGLQVEMTVMNSDDERLFAYAPTSSRM